MVGTALCRTFRDDVGCGMGVVPAIGGEESGSLEWRGEKRQRGLASFLFCVSVSGVICVFGYSLVFAVTHGMQPDSNGIRTFQDQGHG